MDDHGATRRSWDPLRAMALTDPLSTSVQVQPGGVPAGGMLSFIATGFDRDEPLRVFLDFDTTTALAVVDPAAVRSQERVPIPSATEPGWHTLSFRSAGREFDLLVEVTANSATATVDRTRVAAGEVIGIELSGFPPGEVAHVKLDDEGAPGSPMKVRGDGTASGSFTVPPDTAPGPHHLRFLAPDPPTSALVAISVTQ